MRVIRGVASSLALMLAVCPLMSQPKRGNGVGAQAEPGIQRCRKATEGGASRSASRTISNASVCVSVSRGGAYTIADRSTGLALAGLLPVEANGLQVRTGSDALGSYREIVAAYGDDQRSAVLRLYLDRPAVLLLDRHRGADKNAAPFPAFRVEPDGLMRASYNVAPFASIEFGRLETERPPRFFRKERDARVKLDSEGPWLFFDSERNAMVLSPADSFLVSALAAGGGGEMQSGIDARIETLPPRFVHGTLLVFGEGINRTLAEWGKDLQLLGHKRPVGNDADVLLKKFGYWTDNGASYYYKFDPKLGYEGTLLAVRDQYRQLGVPIAYMQLDSWWYPKQDGNKPDSDNGETVYRADPKIFPDGLAAFHKRMGLPFAVHARAIGSASPYRKKYEMSNNVVIDPRFWNATAAYLKQGGVAAYEQDWLSYNARPAINIAQSHQFLASMARGMAKFRIGIQYCMALPGYFLASTQFQNVRTIRVSGDRFGRSHWDSFLYASALAHVVGLWPWSDVFMSAELPNLVISTLSAGPVGTGDALGKIDASNLKRVMRADSVILKPDTPLRPIDDMYLADAATVDHKAPAQPMVAETASDFGDVTEHYVFSYPRVASQTETTVTLRQLGISFPVYAWDWVRGKGEIIPAGGKLRMQYRDGWSYEVLAPVDEAGIALLGDTSKIVPLARKRFTAVSNNGRIEATIAFASGEASVEVVGYAAKEPAIGAVTGKVGDVHYDSTTHLFSFKVFPGLGQRAKVRIS